MTFFKILLRKKKDYIDIQGYICQINPSKTQAQKLNLKVSRRLHSFAILSVIKEVHYLNSLTLFCLTQIYTVFVVSHTV